MAAKENDMTLLEQEIREALTVPGGDPNFLSNLRSQVLAHPQNHGRNRPFFAYRPVWISVIITAFIAGMILIIGPTRVLAEFQYYLSYIPGAGFVDTTNGSVLKVSVCNNHDGRTVCVEQFVASENETILVLRLEGYTGIPQNGFLSSYVKIKLADDSTLIPGDYYVRSTTNPGEFVGVYKFKPLPNGARKVTVSWNEINPNQSARLNYYSVKLHLLPIGSSETAQFFPGSYEITDNSAEHLGITLMVDKVSSSGSETGIRTLILFPDAFLYVLPEEPILKDAWGKEYPEDPIIHLEDQGMHNDSIEGGAGASVMKSDHWTFDFPGVPPNSPSLTLLVERMSFLATPYSHFQIKIPENAAVGTAWPVHEKLVLGEITVEVTQARLEKLDGQDPARVGLVLDLAYELSGQVETTGVWLSVNGSTEQGAVFDEDTKTWTPTFLQNDLPTGFVDLQITRFSGLIFGSWQIQWQPEG